MKIFFSLNHFLPQHIAGIEVYTFNLAKCLQAAGEEVAVLIPNFDNVLNDTYIHEGIRIIQYAENSENSREMVMGKVAPSGLDAFKKILIEEKPDLVHFQEIAAGRGISRYHAEAAKELGIKVFITMHLSTYSCETGNLVYKQKEICDGIIRTHRCSACAFEAKGMKGVRGGFLKATSRLLYNAGIDSSAWNSQIGTALGYPFLIDQKKKFLKRLAGKADKVIVLTSFYKKILTLNGVSPGKIECIGQGLTGKPSNNIIYNDTSLPLRLVFAGRVSKYKGLHIILEALSKLDPEKISLDIYGQTTEDDYASACLKHSRSMPNVQWKGSIDNNSMIRTLAGYDLLCLASTFSEMSPLVIQEAFAAGVPVLASDVYGNAEQIKNGVNGWLFAFKNAKSLKEKLEMLIANPALIDEAKKSLPETKGFDKVAEEHLRLYREVVESSRLKV